MQDFVNRDTNLPINNTNTLNKKERWLNKDRLWNFVFWFGMSFGLSIATTLRDLNIMSIAKPLYVITLIGIPSLLWYFNRTLFTVTNTFTNNEGKEITKDQLPYSWPFAAVCGPLVAFAIAETMFPKGSLSIYGDFIESFIVFFLFISGFSLYFILKNCPITILFNKHTWSMRTTGMFATPQESAEFGVKLFNVVDSLDAKLKSERNK